MPCCYSRQDRTGSVVAALIYAATYYLSRRIVSLFERNNAPNKKVPCWRRLNGIVRLQVFDDPMRNLMTESTATEVQQLVQQGRAAALAGDTYAARTSFRRATELNPASADAWAGL